MIDTHPEIAAAHEDDRLCFGTVDSWLVYVSLSITSVLFCSTADRVTFSPSPRT
jgi:glycerol kinase